MEGHTYVYVYRRSRGRRVRINRCSDHMPVVHIAEVHNAWMWSEDPDLYCLYQSHCKDKLLDVTGPPMGAR